MSISFTFPSLLFTSFCTFHPFYSFSPSLHIYLYFSHSLLPVLFSLILFLAPFSSLSLLFTFLFPSPLPFQPHLPFFLPFPLLPLHLFSPFSSLPLPSSSNFPKSKSFPFPFPVIYLPITSYIPLLLFATQYTPFPLLVPFLFPFPFNFSYYTCKLEISQITLI